MSAWAPVAITAAVLVGLYKLGSAELPSLEAAISYKLTSGPAATTNPIIQSSSPVSSGAPATGLTSDQVSQLQSLLNLAQNLNSGSISSGTPPSSTSNTGGSVIPTSCASGDLACATAMRYQLPLSVAQGYIATYGTSGNNTLLQQYAAAHGGYTGCCWY